MVYVRCPESNLNNEPLRNCFKCAWFQGINIHNNSCSIDCGIDELQSEENLPLVVQWIPKTELMDGSSERILD